MVFPRQIARGIDRSPEQPVLFERRGEAVLPVGAGELADDQRRGDLPYFSGAARRTSFGVTINPAIVTEAAVDAVEGGRVHAIVGPGAAAVARQRVDSLLADLV